MLPQLLLALLLPCVLPVHAADAQDSLAQTCAGLKDLSTCKVHFTVPTGVNVTTKTVSESKYNKCKLKKKRQRRCPTEKDPKRMCYELTCVPGYDKTTKVVPTGLKVLTKKVDLCQTVRKVLGTSRGETFIKSSDAICKCIPRLDELSTTESFKSVSQKGVISSENAKVVAETQTLEKCIVAGGFKVESDQADVEASLESSGNIIIARASEVDEVLYGQIFASIKSCQKGACDTTLINTTFGNYVNSSNSRMKSQFLTLANQWQDLVRGVYSSSSRLTGFSGSFKGMIESTKPQLDSIKSYCDGNAKCKRPGIASFFQYADDLLASSNSLWKVREELKPDDLVPLFPQIGTAIQQAGDLLNANSTVALVKEGKIKTMKDLFRFMPMINQLSTISKDMKTRFASFNTIMAEYLPKANSALEKLTQFSNGYDAARAELLQGDGELDGKLAELRQLIEPPFGAFLSQFKENVVKIKEQLNSSSVTNGTFAMKMDVAAYHRWSQLPSMAMPCSKQTTKTYEKAGFTKEFTYPTYFKCTLGNTTTMYLPRKIPYVKFIM